MEDSELFRQYRETKDVAVRNKIVEKYLYIAAVLAKKFVGRGVEYDDLYQVACLALIKGVERFDESKGLKFSTFITASRLRHLGLYAGGIQVTVRDPNFRDRSRLIHLPRRVAELRVSLKKASDEILSQTGKKPTIKQLAERLHVSEEEIVRAMEAGGVVSLDRTTEKEDDEGMNFYDILASDDGALESFENRDAIRSAVKGLNETERTILDYRFRQELSQTETARRMGVSQMYVSRMERKILEKLRTQLSKDMAD